MCLVDFILFSVFHILLQPVDVVEGMFLRASYFDGGIRRVGCDKG